MTKPKPARAAKPTNGLLSASVPAERVTRPIFATRGLAVGTLVQDWPVVVGSGMASYTLPLGIKHPRGQRTEGVLTMKVAMGGFATTVMHEIPQIVERINGYYGYKSVAEIRIVQGPLPAPRPLYKKPPLEAPEQFKPNLDQVTDPDLRAALTGLARRLGG
jgi:hypothetical protein